MDLSREVPSAMDSPRGDGWLEARPAHPLPRVGCTRRPPAFQHYLSPGKSPAFAHRMHDLEARLTQKSRIGFPSTLESHSLFSALSGLKNGSASTLFNLKKAQKFPRFCAVELARAIGYFASL